MEEESSFKSEEAYMTSNKSTPERLDDRASVGRETPEKNPADPPELLAEQIKCPPSPPPLPPQGRVERLLQRMKHKLLTSYFVQHLIAWVFLSLLLGAVFYGAGQGRVAFIDALYMTVSAITATSLSSIDLSQKSLGFGPSIATFLFFAIGGAVFESAIPIVLRLWRTRGTRARNPMVKREREAIFRLLIIIACYYVGVQLFGFICFGIYLQFSDAGAKVMANNGQNAWWFALFHSCGSFENAGFSLLPDSYVQFNKQPFPLLLVATLVTVGNVAYPIVLRFIIASLLWLCRRFRLEEGATIFKYILTQPRQCLTHLMPSRETWILVYLLVAYLVAASLVFMGLEWNGEAFQTALPGANGFFKWLNAFFQITQVRTSGPNSAAVGQYTGASLILLAGAMYLSAYPLAIVMRMSNEELKKSSQEKTSKYQLTRLLSFDFVLIFLPWFLIAILEGPLYDTDLFAVFFEVLTAYGNVGCSIGASGVNYSLSGTWSIPSKLLIIAIMLMGRHRGMPDDVDGAFKDEYSDDEDPPDMPEARSLPPAEASELTRDPLEPVDEDLSSDTTKNEQ